MKTPKVQEVKLPYASTVASFFSDQGAAPSSFLGRFFKSAARQSVVQTNPGNTTSNGGSSSNVLSGALKGLK